MTSNDDTAFLSTLEQIEINRETIDDEMEQHIHNMYAFTNSNQQHIDHLNTYHNGETICIFVEILDQELAKGNKSNKRMISECITILGRILSSSQIETFSNMFMDEDGIETIYNKILLSSKYKKNEQIIYSVVDFLMNIKNNKHIGHELIVLNNEDYQFIFQIASILKKQSLNYNFGEIMNRFAILLCDLYHENENTNNHNNNEDEEEDDDDDDENNIKSILNSLIFTGFVTTISKRTAMIKADSVIDIGAMIDIIMVLMACNPKKTCSKFINASLPKRILEFISCNESDKALLQKLFQCLTLCYTICSPQTLNQLKENQYMHIISSVNQIHHKIAHAFMNAIHPQIESVSPSNRSIEDEKTFESTDYGANNMEVIESKEFELEHVDETMDQMIVDISEQENASTMNPDLETETESELISPKTKGDTTHGAQPPHATQQRVKSDGSSYMAELPPLPDKAPPNKPLPLHTNTNTNNHRREDGSDMHLVLDAIHDIQDTIMSLQQSMDKKAPHTVKKYVAEHHAPRYSGIEQQRFIDAETARIMAERQEEKGMNLAELREEEEEDEAMNHKQKKKKQEEIVYDSDSGDKVWNKFRKYYHKYIENSKSERAVQSLRNILERLRAFGHKQQKQCIDSLLRCKNRETVICNFLFCLQICDDVIRENVVECLDSLYDLADEDFILFAHNNNITDYLCKALMVRHDQLTLENTASSMKNQLLNLSSTGSARVDMKILQVLAVNFSGKDLLFHRVFNKVKECIMSPYQHIDFIVYAMQVIKTIIQDTDNTLIAKRWINRECVGDMNLDHTIQFAVFIMQTYGESEAAVLARATLETMRIDVNKALIEYGLDIDADDDDVIKGITPGHHGHNKNISNFYKHLERDQMRKQSLEYQKLKDWIMYIQRECNNSHINNGMLNDNRAIVETFRSIKRFMMAHDKEEMWNCFHSINSIHILCDLIAIILMGNKDLWNKLLIGILDVLVLYINHEERHNHNKQRNATADQYIMKCMIDILLRFISISSKASEVMSKACFILDTMTHKDRVQKNAQLIPSAVDYGAIECMLNVISHYNYNGLSSVKAQNLDKQLIQYGLNYLNNLCVNNDKNKKLLMLNHGGCSQILSMLRPSMVDDSDEDDIDFGVITAILKLLLSLTEISDKDVGRKNELEASETVTCNLILVLINQNSILNTLYNAIELLQNDKHVLYLLMELLLNLCSNCNKLSVDVQSWVVRIVLEFSNKYQKSQNIHCFMIRIVTAIIKHDPATNVQILLKDNGASLIYTFELMKLCQYKEEVVVLVFEFMQVLINISEDLTKHFITKANILKFIVHVMKNWYLNDKESTASRILIIQHCCRLIADLCFNDECSEIANQSHVTSSLIKLVIAHESVDSNKNNDKLKDDLQSLKKNIYLIRIPMFIQVLHTIGALTRQNDDIALKVAKHAIKTMIKGVEMHITSDPNDKINSYHRVKSQSNPQHKLLLTVFMEYLSVITSFVSLYIIKYDVASILVPALEKYSESSHEDFAMCCKLIDFLSLLLSSNSKAFQMLESESHGNNRPKTSQLVNDILTTQKNSYRSYQPLMDSCHRYNTELKKCVYKINHAPTQTQNGSPIPIMQSTTGPIPTMPGRTAGAASVPPNFVHNHNQVPQHPNYANNFYPNYNGYHQTHHSQPAFVAPPPHTQKPAHLNMSAPPAPPAPPTIFRHRPVFSSSQSNSQLTQSTNGSQGQSSPLPHTPQALPNSQPALLHTMSMNSMEQMKQRGPQPRAPRVYPNTPPVGSNVVRMPRFNPHTPPPNPPPPLAPINPVPNPPPAPPAPPANPPNVIPNVYHRGMNNMNRGMMNNGSKKNNRISQQLPTSLMQLLTTGSLMTKYPSIHTQAASHMRELDKMKSKLKIVRVSPDWQTIEFHNIPGHGNNKSATKPPKVLPIANMKYIASEHANNRSIANTSKSAKELLIYGLDKNGKEIVIKLLCQNVNDTKRWTRALNQIINQRK